MEYSKYDYADLVKELGKEAAEEKVVYYQSLSEKLGFHKCNLLATYRQHSLYSFYNITH